MPLWTLLTVSSGVYLAIRLHFQPLAEASLKDDNTLHSIAKAGTLGGLKAMRSLAAIGFLVPVAAYLIAWLLPLTGIALPVVAPHLLSFVGSVKEAAASTSSGLSSIFFLFIAAAMLWLTKRSAAADREIRVNAAVRTDLDRLMESARASGWEDLAPTSAMLEVQQAFIRLKDATERGAVPDRTDAERELAHLEEIWRTLDVERRLNPKVEDPLVGHGSLDVIFSAGTYAALGSVRKRVGQVAAISAVAALVGVAAPSVEAAAESAQIRLSDLVVMRDATAAMEAWKAEARQDATPDDEQVLDEVAVAFEHAFARSLLARTAVTPATDTVKRYWARRRVLDVVVANAKSPEVSQYPSMSEIEGLSSAQRDALRDVMPAPRARGPKTAIGREFREHLVKDLRGTQLWGRLKAARDAFRQPLSAPQVANDLINDAVASVIGLAPQPTDEVSRRFVKVLQAVGKSAVLRYKDLKLAQFDRELARGATPAEIIRVLSGEEGTFQFLDSASLKSVAEVRATTLRALPVDELARQPPRLRQVSVEAPPDSSGDWRTLVRRADGVAVYEDFFPGQSGGVQQTLRTKWLSQLAESNSAAATVAKNLVDGVATSERRLLGTALSTKALDGFSRVGGIVLGLDPEHVRDSGIVGLRWMVDGQFVTLSAVVAAEAIPLGRFSAETIRTALGYAADDRRLAVTVLNAERSHGSQAEQRVILHPALLDTSVGAAIISVDKFAFDATKGSRTYDMYRDALVAQDELYMLAVVSRLKPHLKPGEFHTSISHVQQGLIATWKPRLATELGRSAEWLMLNRRPDYYDAKTVAAIRTMSINRDTNSTTFVRAMEEIGVESVDEAERIVSRLRVSLGFASGVREGPYGIDRSLAFVRVGTQLEPLTFKFLARFDAPGVFSARDAATNGSLEIEPWAFPETGDLMTTSAIQAWVTSDKPRAADLEVTKEFALLQRLFRAGFNGHLDPDFDVHCLVDLAESLPPRRSVSTPRWIRP